MSDDNKSIFETHFPHGIGGADGAAPARPEITEERAAEYYESHQKFMAALDHEKPGSLYYNQPKACEAARAKAQADFEQFCLTRGIPLFREPTTQEQALHNLEQTLQDPHPNFVAMLDAEAARIMALPAADRKAMIDGVIRDLGESALESAIRTSSLTRSMGHAAPFPRKEDAARLGKQEFDRLCRQAAHAVTGPLSEAAMAHLPTLKFLASRGRALQSFNQQKAAILKPAERRPYFGKR